MEAEAETVEQLKEQAKNHRAEEGHVVELAQPREKPFISLEKVERIIEAVYSSCSPLEKNGLDEAKDRIRGEVNEGDSTHVRHLPAEYVDLRRS